MMDTTASGRNVLVVDDDLVCLRLLDHVLTTGGYTVATARGSSEALNAIRTCRYDVMLVDWMMPGMDGIELIRHVRKIVSPAPLIIMVTAIEAPGARAHALDAGADDYIAKPFSGSEIRRAVGNGLDRMDESAPEAPVAPRGHIASLPPFVAVLFAAGTGGVPSLVSILNSIPAGSRSVPAFFIVQHAPPWIMPEVVRQLEQRSSLRIELAERGTRAYPGGVFVAPGGQHMLVQLDTTEASIDGPAIKVDIVRGSPEHFLRSAADPLFRSAAIAFGRYCVAVVLGGLGSDGTLGAAHVAAGGGMVLAQDVASSTVASMPTNVIKAGLVLETGNPVELGPILARGVSRLAMDLKSCRKPRSTDRQSRSPDSPTSMPRAALNGSR